MDASHKVVLTGIKPTDYPHIGNYLGAIKPGLDLVKNAKTSLLFIADYHALTTVHDAKELTSYVNSVTAAWMASGLNPKTSIIYRQSDIPEIFELAWILSCFAPKGLLNRAHAYKARVQENTEAGKDDVDFGVSMGLYFYPILMAADILLFNTDIVPVGEDQVQHVEIARDIAQKFNRAYGEIIRLPQALVKTEKVIPGIDGRKMSKSYGNHIPLFLESKKLRKLVMKIVTDSSPPEAPKETKGSIIFELYKEFATPEQISALSQRYAKGMGWGEAKETLYLAIEEHFKSKAEIYNRLMANPSGLEQILKEGAVKAREMAFPLMQKLRLAVRGS